MIPFTHFIQEQAQKKPFSAIFEVAWGQGIDREPQNAT